MIVQLGGGAFAKAGACVAPGVLVRPNDAVSAPTLAVTINDPVNAFAVSDGAVATPEALVVAFATVPVPLKVPEAPLLGAVNVTDTRCIG